MKKIIVLISFALVITAQARTKCSQFQDHYEAQKYFDAHKKGYKSLDGDKDGEACECLKGGSSYNSEPCVKWQDKNYKKAIL